jgi:hypothetical protein
MQTSTFDQSTQEEFIQHFQELSQHLSDPNTLLRIKRVNDDSAPFYPRQRVFDALPGETEEELVARWKQGYLASPLAPSDLRASLAHSQTIEHTGFGTVKDSQKSQNFDDFVLNPVTQSLLLSRFMPVIPEALLVLNDNNDVVREELGAGPTEKTMELEDEEIA